MAFRPLRAIPITEFKSAVIANSQTLAVGDAIIPAATGHNKFVTGANNSTGPVLGVVVAILGLNGLVTELQSIAAGASNETNKTYSVQYIPTAITNLEYEAQLDAAAGTTSNSDGLCWFNMSTSLNGKLQESSIALFSGTQGQFWSFGPTPEDNTLVVGFWDKVLGGGA